MESSRYGDAMLLLLAAAIIGSAIALLATWHAGLAKAALATPLGGVIFLSLAALFLALKRR